MFIIIICILNTIILIMKFSLISICLLLQKREYRIDFEKEHCIAIEQLD